VKSFFSSRVSKFNAFMTLCTLGLITVSLPVMAAPPEACVKTSAGDVVCGTPVPKPPKSNQPGNDETIDTQAHEDGVTVELKSCVKGARNTASCTFVLKSRQDQNFTLYTARYAKLVDSAGNEYSSDKVKVGNRTGESFAVPMAKGATYRAVFNFVDVPASLSQVVLLQIGGNYGHLIKFRNVPIN
jgi:hypothetical protein